MKIQNLKCSHNYCYSIKLYGDMVGQKLNRHHYNEISTTLWFIGLLLLIK